MKELQGVFRKHLNKFIETYPGSENDFWYYQSVVQSKNFDSNDNDMPLSMKHIVCLIKARNTLMNIETTVLESSALDNFVDSISDLVYSLKLYIEDIRSLKRFYE